MNTTINELNESISRYYDRIYAYIWRHVCVDEDAYDLTQDVFLAFIGAYEKIDRTKAKQWLYSTAHNIVVDYYKRNRKEREFTEQLDGIDIGDSDKSIEEALFYEDPMGLGEMSEEEELEYKKKVLDSLSEEEKMLYVDVCVERRKIRELTQKYGVSEVALHKRSVRMKHKLRRLVKLLLFVLAF